MLERFVRWSFKKNNRLGVTIVVALILGGIAVSVLVYFQTGSLVRAWVVVVSIQGVLLFAMLTLLFLGIHYGVDPIARSGQVKGDESDSSDGEEVL